MAAGDEVVSGRLRRYFELTDPGAASLALESERQAANALRATDRLKKRAARVAATRPSGGVGMIDLEQIFVSPTQIMGEAVRYSLTCSLIACNASLSRHDWQQHLRCRVQQRRHSCLVEGCRDLSAATCGPSGLPFFLA